VGELKRAALEEKRRTSASKRKANEAKKHEYGGKGESFHKQVGGTMVLRISKELHVMQACKHGIFAMSHLMLLECCRTYVNQLNIVCGVAVIE
jgi:hypothetical protein